MILSIEGEENAKILCEIDELKGINIYSSNSARAIGTAKYIAEMNNVKIKIDNRINGREFYTTMSMKEILLEELEIKRQYLIYLGNSLDNRKICR